MIIGAHSIIYSRRPKKDRAFMRDVIGLPFIDSGDGWLIFGLLPAEVAFHPSKKKNLEEFYLLCDDIDDFVAQMKNKKAKCSKVQKLPWGLLTKLKLPGGGNLKVYQPLHERPKPVRLTRSKKAAG
jgi:hypothetical protein